MEEDEILLPVEEENNNEEDNANHHHPFVLGNPTIRLWEIDDNSTRYDKLRAAPSDESMVMLWYIWAGVFALYTVFNGLVFVAIVLNKRSRRNAFNQYLLALMIPDIIFTGMCAVQCLVLALSGGYRYTYGCQFQAFYIFWAVTSNTYVNMAIAHQVYRLLSSSARRERYFPPSTTTVIKTTILCYCWAFLVASLGTIDAVFFWLPHKSDSIHGMFCSPLEYDLASTIFWYTAFFILIGGIPLGYATFVALRVYQLKLLPPSGNKRREVAIFFFRIYLIFCMMWIPALIFMIIAAGVSFEMFYAGGFFSHANGAVTALVSLYKNDIYEAFWNLVRCRVGHANRDYDGRSTRTSGFTRTSGLVASQLSGDVPPLGEDDGEETQEGHDNKSDHSDIVDIEAMLSGDAPAVSSIVSQITSNNLEEE